jgi:methylmalonyl-CoA mutase cobalamin-binding subunit
MVKVLFFGTDEYYAERFTLPYALVTPFGVDGHRASMITRFSHKQEFVSTDIGIFASKEEAVQTCLDEQAMLDWFDNLDHEYEQGVRDRYVSAGLGNLY